MFALNSTELPAARFDLSSLSQKGSETVAFKSAKSLVPIGKYLATLILECNHDNDDAVVLKGETTHIKPLEPSTIFGLMTTALIFAASNFDELRKFQLSK